jgi:ferric-dicitrate binding protein FerR (iron transport regulator)
MAREGQRAQELLRQWGESPIPPDDPAAAELRRRRVVAATALTIARAASTRARRQRWLRIGTAFASAAALAAVVGVGWRVRSRLHAPRDEAPGPIAQVQLLAGSIHPSHQGQPVPAVGADGRFALGPGDEVATETNGRGEVALTDGVAITLEPRTHVRMPAAPARPAAVAQVNEQLDLDAGSVFVRVPPLQPGHTFSVQTPDALVTVHGTAFAVDVMPGLQGSSATRVRVSSGVVSVASAGREVLLGAGMEWTSPNAMLPSSAERTAVVEPPAQPVVAPPAAATPQARTAATHRGSAHPRWAGHDDNPSTLGEENTLLAAAIAASKNGDYGGAVGMLDDLLRRYPASPVAPEAHVQRFRALEHGGDIAAAAREARTYLALYPEGSAREEAKRVAVEQ